MVNDENEDQESEETQKEINDLRSKLGCFEKKLPNQVNDNTISHNYEIGNPNKILPVSEDDVPDCEWNNLLFNKKINYFA